LSVASFFWFVCSTSGIIVSVLGVTGWLLARPRSRAARTCLGAIAVAYTIVSTYPVPHVITRLLARPFHPLTRADVPSGRSAVVLLGSGSRTRRSWSGDTFSVLDPIGAARTLEAVRVSRLIDAGRVAPPISSERLRARGGVARFARAPGNWLLHAARLDPPCT
jgi:hypothetical protein